VVGLVCPDEDDVRSLENIMLHSEE
jgi:hypothetical protein